MDYREVKKIWNRAKMELFLTYRDEKGGLVKIYKPQCPELKRRR